MSLFWLRDRLTIGQRCFGAASAKDRLDVVIRDAINAGDIPGPRYLANAKEIAKPDGDLVDGITAFASGPEGTVQWNFYRCCWLTPRQKCAASFDTTLKTSALTM